MGPMSAALGTMYVTINFGSIKWSTEIVNDCFSSAARNTRNDRRQPNDGNSHEQFPTLGGQIVQRGT